jgi:hypothetical protein
MASKYSLSTNNYQVLWVDSDNEGKSKRKKELSSFMEGKECVCVHVRVCVCMFGAV